MPLLDVNVNGNAEAAIALAAQGLFNNFRNADSLQSILFS